MPRYRFGLRHLDHSELDDEPEGIDLPDDNTAREFALKIIRGLVQKGDDWEDWVMRSRKAGAGFGGSRSTQLSRAIGDRCEAKTARGGLAVTSATSAYVSLALSGCVEWLKPIPRKIQRQSIQSGNYETCFRHMSFFVAVFAVTNRGDDTGQMLPAKNLHGMALAARGYIETVAVLGYFAKRLSALSKRNIDFARFELDIANGLMGAKHDLFDKAYAPVNILTVSRTQTNTSMLSSLAKEEDARRFIHVVIRICAPEKRRTDGAE